MLIKGGKLGPHDRKEIFNERGEKDAVTGTILFPEKTLLGAPE